MAETAVGRGEEAIGFSGLGTGGYMGPEETGYKGDDGMLKGEGSGYCGDISF